MTDWRLFGRAPDFSEERFEGHVHSKTGSPRMCIGFMYGSVWLQLQKRYLPITLGIGGMGCAVESGGVHKVFLYPPTAPLGHQMAPDCSRALTLLWRLVYPVPLLLAFCIVFSEKNPTVQLRPHGLDRPITIGIGGIRCSIASEGVHFNIHEVKPCSGRLLVVCPRLLCG
jgi:hypothetical protein